jgi:Putative prokaryotic signal transducing protein
MTVTRQSLVDHFERLSDDELLNEFQSGELTALAEDVATVELQRREIDLSKGKLETPQPQAEVGVAPSSEDLVLVARFNDPVSAYLLQSRLDAEGVPAIIADAFAYQNMPFGAGVGGIRVLVPESYCERAAEIKSDIDRGDYKLDDKAE